MKGTICFLLVCVLWVKGDFDVPSGMSLQDFKTEIAGRRLRTQTRISPVNQSVLETYQLIVEKTLDDQRFERTAFAQQFDTVTDNVECLTVRGNIRTLSDTAAEFIDEEFNGRVIFVSSYPSKYVWIYVCLDTVYSRICSKQNVRATLFAVRNNIPKTKKIQNGIQQDFNSFSIPKNSSDFIINVNFGVPRECRMRQRYHG